MNVIGTNTYEIEVEIRQQDIDRGIRFHALACPLTYALQRAFGLTERGAISVGPTRFSLFAGPHAGVYAMPKELRGFLQRYDGGQVRVHPKRYRVTVTRAPHPFPFPDTHRNT